VDRDRDGAGTSFDLEEVLAIRDRAIILWRYRGSRRRNSVRGVNLMRC